MRTALLAVALLAAPASGETFTWTGGGDDPMFSTTANWRGGLVPTGGDGSTVVLPGGAIVQNDLAGLSVGTLEFVGSVFDPVTRATPGSLPIRVTGTVRTDGPASEVPLRLADGVALDVPNSGGFDPSQVAGLFANVTGEPGTYRLTAGSGVILTASDLAGAFDVPAGAYLGAYETYFLDQTGPSAFDVADGFAGTLDVSGTMTVSGDGLLDLAGGTLDLKGIPVAIENDTLSAGTVVGDVRLGQWRVGGYPEYAPPLSLDRLDVTGELDLTQAIITPSRPFSPTLDVYAASPDPADVPAFLTLATYGSRVGAFANDALAVSFGFENDDDGGGIGFFDGLAPIVYTSGENAGSGEVRLMLPEPAAAATFALAAAGLLLRRR